MNSPRLVLAFLLQLTSGVSAEFHEKEILVRKNCIPDQVSESNFYTGASQILLKRTRRRGGGAGGGGGGGGAAARGGGSGNGVNGGSSASSNKEFFIGSPKAKTAGKRKHNGEAQEPPIKKEVALLLVAAALATQAGSIENDKAAKYYLDGVPRPYVQPDDPSDDDINKPLKYQGDFIYQDNPCQFFQEVLESVTNKGRQNGCDKAVERLREAAAYKPSQRCPNIGDGVCLQVSGRTGRCYAIINGDDPASIRYELINRC